MPEWTIGTTALLLALAMGVLARAIDRLALAADVFLVTPAGARRPSDSTEALVEEWRR